MPSRAGLGEALEGGVQGLRGRHVDGREGEALRLRGVQHLGVLLGGGDGHGDSSRQVVRAAIHPSGSRRVARESSGSGDTSAVSPLRESAAGRGQALTSPRERVPGDLLARPAFAGRRARGRHRDQDASWRPGSRRRSTRRRCGSGPPAATRTSTGWTRGDWTPAEGNGPDVCDRVVAELEQQWPAETSDGVPRRARARRDHGVNRLRTLLGEDGTVLLDGGMGTLLQEQGLDDGGSGELWNVERPDVIAGSTRSTRRPAPASSPPTRSAAPARGWRCTAWRTGVHELNRAGAAIATEVARRHGILVAGDLGPTGELLAPLGTMEPAAGPGALRGAAGRPARRRDRRRPHRDDERPRRGDRRRRGRASGRPGRSRSSRP